MDKKLDLKDFVLLGRGFDEYCKMFDLNYRLLENNTILDVASGVSSFCAESNAKGYKVVASDKIYSFDPDEIKEKCVSDLEEVIAQLGHIADLYNWTYFHTIDLLKEQRQKAYSLFIKDIKEHGTKRYIPTNYPETAFRDKQFTLTLVSHFLFLYDEHLTYEFHKHTLFIRGGNQMMIIKE